METEELGDFLTRNTECRVEVGVRVEDPVLVRKLTDILQLQLRDNVNAREMRPDGSYQKVKPAEGEALVNGQMGMYELLKNDWTQPEPWRLSAAVQEKQPEPSAEAAKPEPAKTEAPTETPKPTPTADLTAVPTVSISEKEEQIYKEEADIRKARRRIENSRKNTETETAAAQTQKSYTIRPGDTLYQISIEKYGTMDKVTEICRANGISEDEIIYPGQIIVLP